MEAVASDPSTQPWDTSMGNRFAHYSSINHSATLWIAAALAMTYMIGVLLIRIFIKLRVFGWDDGLVALSTALATAQSIVVFSALKRGLGKISEDVDNLESTGNLTFISRVTFVPAHYLAKLSLVYLVRRLFMRDEQMIVVIFNVSIGVTTLSGIASILLSAINCPASTFFVAHCSHQITRWSLITALDILSEGLNLILPSYMVWQVQMRPKTKLRVIFAFCSRIIVVALSAAHLRTWIKYSSSGPSPFAIVPTLILQQILLASSLISATVPNLKAFLQSLSASWAEVGYRNSGATRTYGNGTFEMELMDSQAPSASRSRGKKLSPMMGLSNFETQVSASRRNAGERSSLGSGESQDLIIRKETAWTVERT